MFDIGFWELLLIGTVTLLVVGPDRLPALATFAGHWIGRARRFTNYMRNQIQEELEAEHLKNLVNEQQRELDSLREEVEGVRDEAETAVREVERGARADTGAVARDDDPAETVSAPDSPPSVDQPVADGPGTPERQESASPKPASKKRSAARKKSAAKKKATKKTAAKKASAKNATSARASGSDAPPPQDDER